MPIEIHHVPPTDVIGEDDHGGKCAGRTEAAHLFDIAGQVSAAISWRQTGGSEILKLREALDESQGKKQEYGKSGEPMGDGGCGCSASGEQAQGIQAGEHQHVDERNPLQVCGVRQGRAQVEQQPAVVSGR